VKTIDQGVDDLRDATGARQSKGMTRTSCDHRGLSEP
jgi:hypothetical protein